LESPFGSHLVLVSEEVPALQQPLSAVRPKVEREVFLEHKKKELQKLYDRLLEKYTVKIGPVPALPSGGAAK
jgi:helix-turn-helix protein